VALLDLGEVDSCRRDCPQDIRDPSLDVIDLDGNRVAHPAHHTGAPDRRGKDARPVVGILIQRPNAFCGRIHVLADDGTDLPQWQWTKQTTLSFRRRHDFGLSSKASAQRYRLSLTAKRSITEVHICESGCTIRL